MRPSTAKLLFASIATGGLLIAAFTLTVVRDREGLGIAIRQTIIERDAAVLHPVVLQQLADARTHGDTSLAVILRAARQEGMLAVAVFAADGRPWRHLPTSLLLADLPLDDLFHLQTRHPISRYHTAFPLDHYFRGMAPDQSSSPVLEILLPLYEQPSPQRLLGYAQYLIDARRLSHELTTIDQRIQAQTTDTLLLGGSLITGLMTVATIGLIRSQRIIAERNARLTRANFDLTLSAKASALGQITSHLMHGLQGPVAGLRAAMAGHHGNDSPDWVSASAYTERLQTLVQEAITFLGDTRTQTHYELTGDELATLIRERNTPEATRRGLTLQVTHHLSGTLDSHPGSILCLIAHNLIQNALHVSPPESMVSVALTGSSDHLSLRVSDEGPGIPEKIRTHLFEPGYSGRDGGTGLGLAISQLLARQIGATLSLVRTGQTGTIFQLTRHLAPTAPA